MRFTIKTKLALGFGLLIVILGGIAGEGLYALSVAKHEMDMVVDGTVARLDKTHQINALALATVRSQKNIILATTKEEAQKYEKLGDEERKAMDTLVKEMTETAGPETKAFWEDLTKISHAFEATDDRVREYVDAGNTSMAATYAAGPARDAANAFTNKLEEAVALNRQRLEASKQIASDDFEQTRMVMVTASITAFIIAIITATWIAMGISRGIRKIMDVADAIAVGDLNQNVEITSNDEIKDLVNRINLMTANLRDTAAVANEIADGNLTVTPKPLSDRDTLGLALERMVERLRGVVADAISAADNVTAGSQELNASSEQLSQGATEQVSAAEQASAAMEQMAANIKQNADMLHRLRKLHANPLRTPKQVVKPLDVQLARCAQLLKRSPSFRKLRVRLTFLHLTRLLRQLVLVNTVKDLQLLRRKCANSQNALRQQLQKSPRSLARPSRSQWKLERC